MDAALPPPPPPPPVFTTAEFINLFVDVAAVSPRNTAAGGDILVAFAAPPESVRFKIVRDPFPEIRKISVNKAPFVRKKNETYYRESTNADKLGGTPFLPSS